MRYHTEKIHCPECLGDGVMYYTRPEPWVSRDTPPAMEEYTRPCWACHGSGEVDDETGVDDITF